MLRSLQRQCAGRRPIRRGLQPATAGINLPGIRSLHLRHVRAENADAIVAKPVHVLYYRVVEPGVIEIVRVLHERMEPSLHIG
jgi:plasmid stabilization system protein ParE